MQRIPTGAETQARAIYIEGAELAELTRGAVVGYLVAGKAFSIDGTGFKTAADAAPSKCAAPAPNTQLTAEQMKATVAQVQAKVDQMKAAENAALTNKPAVTPGANVPPTPAPPTPAPSVKQGPGAPPAAPPSPGPGTPATTGSIGSAVNPANLSPEALALLGQQVQQQQRSPKLSDPIVNSLCPATVVSRMQALPLTNAQISQICR
jgi:hypothetical protein